jgi:hypothetical protein
MAPSRRSERTDLTSHRPDDAQTVAAAEAGGGAIFSANQQLRPQGEP